MVSHWQLIKKNPNQQQKTQQQQKTKQQNKLKKKKNFGPLPSIGIVKSHEGEDIHKIAMEIEKKRHERASSHAVDAAPS